MYIFLAFFLSSLHFFPLFYENLPLPYSALGKTSSSNSSFSSSNSSPSSLPSFRFSKDTEELLEIINEPPEPITAEDQKHTNQTNNEDPGNHAYWSLKQKKPFFQLVFDMLPDINIRSISH